MSQQSLQELEYSTYAEQNNVYTGNLSEQKLRYYNQATGQNYNNLAEAERAFLAYELGSDEGSLQQMWLKYFQSKGITSGSLSERKIEFFTSVGFFTSAGSGSLLLESSI